MEAIFPSPVRCVGGLGNLSCAVWVWYLPRYQSSSSSNRGVGIGVGHQLARQLATWALYRIAGMNESPETKKRNHLSHHQMISAKKVPCRRSRTRTRIDFQKPRQNL
jgi:hypothetical protein